MITIMWHFLKKQVVFFLSDLLRSSNKEYKLDMVAHMESQHLGGRTGIATSSKSAWDAWKNPVVNNSNKINKERVCVLNIGTSNIGIEFLKNHMTKLGCRKA